MIAKPCKTDFALEGKVAVVTGAASGIGLSIAELFAEKGAKVYMTDRNAAALENAAAAVPGSRALALDVSDPVSVDRVISTVEAETGEIDVLVNSAGVGDIEWAEAMSPETWRKVIEINLSGTFFVSQRVGQGMIRRGQGGRIVSLASQAGIVAIDKHVAYSASKAGIISMTRSLAYEWGKYAIGVNCISPTATETPIIVGYWDEPERMAKTLTNTPAGRYCKPIEVAAAALFLASDASTMITGENLVIDGGYTIH